MNDFFKDTNNIGYLSGLHKWPSEGHDTPAMIIQPAEAVLRPVRGTAKHLDNTVTTSQKNKCLILFQSQLRVKLTKHNVKFGLSDIPPKKFTPPAFIPLCVFLTFRLSWQEKPKGKSACTGSIMGNLAEDGSERKPHRCFWRHLWPCAYSRQQLHK